MTGTAQPRRIDDIAREFGPAGISVLGHVLTPGQCLEIQKALAGVMALNGHPPSLSDGIEREMGDDYAQPFASYRLPTIMGLPFLIETFASEWLQETVGQCLGYWPLIYSLDLFWTMHQPGFPHADTVAKNHRDTLDDGGISAFVYLTDVKSPRDGPHVYLIGSHQGESKGDAAVMGGAGTMILADPMGLHRDEIPQRSPRLAAWARYGREDAPGAGTPSYRQNGTKPIEWRSIAGRIRENRINRDFLRLLAR